MFKKVYLCAVFFLPCFLLGQTYKIAGTIRNTTDEKPIEYADVSLLNTDSTAVRNVYTNEAGFFQLESKSGKYLLQIRYLRSLLYTKELLLEADVNLGTIAIDAVKSLQGASIIGRKRLIERKVDRLVFNVENSILSGGVDLTQVLKSTPMLSVSDFGISLVGKSSVAVMINEKIVNMSGSDLMNYLKSLRSDDIAKIEVITTPPARYEAQGNSGLINIVLKKNNKPGWSGNASTAFILSSYAGYSNTLSLNFQSKKLHTTLRLRQYDRANRSTENINLLGANSILSSDIRKDGEKGIGANLNLNYKINPKTNIGFIYDAGSRHSNMDIENQSAYKTGNLTDSILGTSAQHRNPILVQTLNVFFDRKFDSLGKKLSLGINYFRNTPETVVNFQTRSSESSFLNRVRNTSDINYAIISGQADIYLPFPDFIFETGLKYTHFRNSSDVKYLHYSGSEFVVDPARSNIFAYEESNAAVYASANRNFGKKWSAKAGLRYEYSDINGFSVTTGSRTTFNYGNLFPTAYLQYNPNDNHSFSFNYAKRINRPNFGALNPFRWYSNPYTFSTGNPVLQPSYNHNLEWGYLYKDRLSLSLYAQKTVNGYGRIVYFQNGIKEVNYRNYLTEYNYGLNANFYFLPVKWWELNSSLVTYYSESKSAVADVLPQQGFSVYYDLSNTYTLSASRQIFFFLNFSLSLPSRQGNVYSESLSPLSSGFRFSLLQKKVRVNAAVEDIYRGLVGKGKVYFNDFTQTYNNYYDTRRLTLNVSYVFGSNKVKANAKQVRFEEKNRAN